MVNGLNGMRSYMPTSNQLASSKLSKDDKDPGDTHELPKRTVPDSDKNSEHPVKTTPNVNKKNEKYYAHIGNLSNPDAKHFSWNNKATINGMNEAEKWAQEQVNQLYKNNNNPLNQRDVSNPKSDELALMLKLADLNNDKKIEANEYLALTMLQDKLGNKDGMITDLEKANAMKKIQADMKKNSAKIKDDINKYKKLIDQIKRQG